MNCIANFVTGGWVICMSNYGAPIRRPGLSWPRNKKGRLASNLMRELVDSYASLPIIVSYVM